MSVQVGNSLFDSVTGLSFGPAFDTPEEAEDFLEFLTEIGERDPRHIPAGELAQLHSEWQKERE